ncbi:MAG TPA: NAD(P)H-dependent oxidoreductase [Anaerolineales bacterium]|nr:NAD(P)H-dependent oxidoreductase [Anaerolineales bacterium]
MKTLILDGSNNADPVAVSVRSMLTDRLRAHGSDVEYVLLSDQKIANCQGDFFCWVRSPGMCALDDDNRAIARTLVNSDLLIYLTPITFGGYSSQLKRTVDHMIQNISPFFTRVEGEIHHRRRYRSYPRLLVFGWLPGGDPASEAIFRHLVQRNALNMYASAAVGAVIDASQTAEEIHGLVDENLGRILSGKGSVKVALPSLEVASGPRSCETRRALLLVGSPRGKTSTSQALGSYLFEGLASQGVETESMRLYSMMKSASELQKLFEAVEAADLVTLAFPLYVDSLPGPVIGMLEKIAEQRRKQIPAHPQRFTTIVNCGFPESGHNETALAICRNFARLTGFEWAGGLSLGGGEGVVHGNSLHELDGRAIPLKKSLELAAQALGAGKPVPQEAIELMARPVVSSWLYWLLGGYGWKQQAKSYGVQNQLKARPYELK